MPRIDGNSPKTPAPTNTADFDPKKLAAEIDEAGEDKFWGTDEDAFIKIVSGLKDQPDKLKQVDDEYIARRKHGIIVAAGIEMSGEDLRQVEDCFNVRDKSGKFTYFNPDWQAEKFYNAGEGYDPYWFLPTSWEGTDEARFNELAQELKGMDKEFIDTDQSYGKLFHADQKVRFKDAKGGESEYYSYGVLRAADDEMDGTDQYQVEDVAPLSPYLTAQILHAAAEEDDQPRFYEKVKLLETPYMDLTRAQYKYQFKDDLTKVISKFSGPTRQEMLAKFTPDPIAAPAAPTAAKMNEPFKFYFDPANSPDPKLFEDIRSAFDQFNAGSKTYQVALEIGGKVPRTFGNERPDIYFTDDMRDKDPMFFIQTSRTEVDWGINAKLFSSDMVAKPSFHQYFTGEVAKELNVLFTPGPIAAPPPQE